MNDKFRIFSDAKLLADDLRSSNSKLYAARWDGRSMLPAWVEGFDPAYALGSAVLLGEDDIVDQYEKRSIRWTFLKIGNDRQSKNIYLPEGGNSLLLLEKRSGIRSMLYSDVPAVVSRSSLQFLLMSADSGKYSIMEICDEAHEAPEIISGIIEKRVSVWERIIFGHQTFGGKLNEEDEATTIDILKENFNCKLITA